MIFDIKQIHKQFPITGAMHVGAFAGEELLGYRSIGLANTILFEPQVSLYELVKSKLLFDEKIYNVALGSEDCEKELFISHRDGGVSCGSGASSSLLKPKKHLSEHPEVTFPEIETVKVKTLDEFYKDGYNFLNIDVQGFELEVLKGACDSLKNIDSMIVEVNRDEVYSGCPMIEDIDNFLQDFNFTRIEVAWQSKSWGDAFYAKI
tara:strand:- start:159 stop:776 length:618 start_codon:yes stop_codon:yes gene_type:complete